MFLMNIFMYLDFVLLGSEIMIERGLVNCFPARLFCLALSGSCLTTVTMLEHVLTHGDMRWVAGLRKWMLRTPTVTKMERVTRIMVKSRYLPEIK